MAARRCSVPVPVVAQNSWKKRPLFRRTEGDGPEEHDGLFRTGAEAADLL